MGVSSTEQATIDRAEDEPMLDHVLAWAALNSGSRNLAGLERMADGLVDAFAALPGIIRLENPAPVEAVNAAGRTVAIEHGRHLHLTVRPTEILYVSLRRVPAQISGLVEARARFRGERVWDERRRR